MAFGQCNGAGDRANGLAANASGRVDRARTNSANAYFSSTLAPASSSFFLMLSASALATRFLHRLRGALDEVLRLLQAKPGDGAHFLDDVDLLVAGGGQDHVELGLLLDRSGGSGATAGGGNRHRSGGGHAPLLFEQLGELAPPPARSGWRGRQRFSIDQPLSRFLVGSNLDVSVSRSASGRLVSALRRPRTRVRAARRAPAGRPRCGSPASGSCRRSLRAVHRATAARREPRHPSASRLVRPMAPPSRTNFSFVLANSAATFGAATGSSE